MIKMKKYIIAILCLSLLAVIPLASASAHPKAGVCHYYEITIQDLAQSGQTKVVITANNQPEALRIAKYLYEREGTRTKVIGVRHILGECHK